MQEKPQVEGRMNDAQRAQLIGALRSLFAASLQKIFLLSPQVVALQLRLPGRTLFAGLDARTGLAALLAERPAAAAGRESAPKAQATLRAALAGAILRGARLERPAAASEESRRLPSLRLSFETPQGPRALVAEPRAGVLALLAPARGGEPVAPANAAEPEGGQTATTPEAEAAPQRERIVWIGAAVGELRAGSDWPPSREVALPMPAQVPSTSAEPEAEATAGLAERAHAQAERASLEALRRALAKRLRARVDKLDRTLRAVEKDLVRAHAAEEERQKARLLLPEQGRVPRGAREVRVPDWSRLDEAGRPAEVVLALDPALSAAQNAARWLKRAQRYAAALPRIEARLAEVRGSLAQARELLERAEAAPDAAALRELELREPTPGPPREGGAARPGRAPGSRRLPFRCFRSQGGARILVGRSARDNDALTFKAARGNDLWLHARGVQGSHVIVPDPGPTPAGELLLEAALLAGHFSSARGADQVEVAWTRRKHVRKQKGAPPGAVVYAQEKTLRVRLGGEGLAALLAREEK
jgi:hypothetical protein